MQKNPIENMFKTYQVIQSMGIAKKGGHCLTGICLNLSEVIVKILSSIQLAKTIHLLVRMVFGDSQRVNWCVNWRSSTVYSTQGQGKRHGNIL